MAAPRRGASHRLGRARPAGRGARGGRERHQPRRNHPRRTDPAVVAMAVAAPLLVARSCSWCAGVPSRSLRRRCFGTACFVIGAATSFGVGMALFGAVTYLPTFLRVALALMLPQVPLARDGRGGAGEPAISCTARREQRWDVSRRLGRRAGLELPPPQLWLLARLGERAGGAGGAHPGSGADAGEVAGAAAGLPGRATPAPGPTAGAHRGGRRTATPACAAAPRRAAGTAARLGPGRPPGAPPDAGRPRALVRRRGARAGARARLSRPQPAADASQRSRTDSRAEVMTGLSLRSMS